MNRRSASTIQRRIKAKRATALYRTEFRYPSAERAAAAGATSFPVKVMPESLRALIDEALAAHKRKP